MHTFAVIAIRLIGLWIIAGSTLGLTILLASFASGYGLLRIEMIELVMVITPIVVGMALIAFSKPLAERVIAGVESSSAPPDGITVRGFTQMGVFLLGLFVVLPGLPYLVASFTGQVIVSIDQWIALGLGLLLMFSCVGFGNLIERLRR